MTKTSYFFLLFLVVLQYGFSQTINLLGQVQSTANVENIHVINKTAQRFTVTNQKGVFRLQVSLNDTLVFTSIQHKQKSVTITPTIIKNKTLVLTLEEQINKLDQVVVGKVLTGNMLSDVSHVTGEPMTSKKAGIPSYQGPLKTQSQRLLHEATTGGGIVPLNPIINALSGRTKKLKKQILLEEKETLMYSIINRLSDDLFSENPLPKKLVMEYFYFVSEQPDFLERCKNKTDLLVLKYLKEQMQVYKVNRNSLDNANN